LSLASKESGDRPGKFSRPVSVRHGWKSVAVAMAIGAGATALEAVMREVIAE
jgi:hypothetical protein